MKTTTLIQRSKRHVWTLLLSSLASDLGSSIFSYGLSFFILDRTHSVFSFALSAFLAPLVSLLCLPLIGPMVDRFSKKKILLLSQAFSIFSLVLYAFFYPYIQQNLLPATILLLLCLRLSDQFTMTARQAAVRELVLEADLQRVAANGQLSASFSLLLSSVLGAILYALLPFQLFIAIEIIAESLAFALFLLLHYPLIRKTPTLPATTETVLPQQPSPSFREGIAYLKRQPFLRSGILCATLINFCSGIFSVGLPVFVLQELAATKLQYGWAEAAHAAGFLAGSLFLSNRPPLAYPLLNLWQSIHRIGFLLIAIGCASFFTPSLGYLLLLFLLFASGGIFVFLNVPYTVWLQQELPLALQGRLFSLLSTLGLASAPLGISFFGGILSLPFFQQPAGARLLFLLTGCTLLLFIFFYRKFTSLNPKKAKLN